MFHGREAKNSVKLTKGTISELVCEIFAENCCELRVLRFDWNILQSGDMFGSSHHGYGFQPWHLGSKHQDRLIFYIHEGVCVSSYILVSA